MDADVPGMSVDHELNEPERSDAPGSMADASERTHPKSSFERSGKKPRAEPTPVQRAIGLLSRREHSQKELAAKLAARGVPVEDAQATVQRMAADGWQDDRRFALSLARMRMSHGYGPIRIRAEIGTHRLSEEIAAAALRALDDSGDAEWPARARDLVRRRYGEPSTVARDARLRRKAVDFLMRRGFDGDCIRHALRDGIDE